jgi:hypothetical protein
MQTAYTDPSASVIGGKFNNAPQDIVTGNSATAIPVGRFVVKDGTTYNDRVKLPAASGDITDLSLARGFAGKAPGVESDSSTTVQTHAAYAAFPVVKKGPLWVRTEQNVTPADPVFIRFTANGTGKDVGQVRKDADTDKAVQATYCRFLQSGSADGLVPVDVNL